MQLVQAEQGPNRHWLGNLSLNFQRRFDATRLTGVEHFGPLRVQRPFYPEGPEDCHVYLLHPPGGMVSGDELLINVNLQQQCSALITTPSAGKIYHGDGSSDSQLQKVVINVAEDSYVEWLPQETIIFNGARGVLDTEVCLEGDAKCFVWDMVCLGRPASDEKFIKGSLLQRLMIQKNGSPIFIERNRFLGSSNLLFAKQGMASHVVCGTAVCNTAIEDNLVELLRERFVRAFSFTQLEQVFVIRYLGDSAEECRLGFEKIWQLLRPIVKGKTASSPRIWRT